MLFPHLAIAGPVRPSMSLWGVGLDRYDRRRRGQHHKQHFHSFWAHRLLFCCVDHCQSILMNSFRFVARSHPSINCILILFRTSSPCAIRRCCCCCLVVLFSQHTKPISTLQRLAASRLLRWEKLSSISSDVKFVQQLSRSGVEWNLLPGRELVYQNETLEKKRKAKLYDFPMHFA